MMSRYTPVLRQILTLALVLGYPCFLKENVERRNDGSTCKIELRGTLQIVRIVCGNMIWRVEAGATCKNDTTGVIVAQTPRKRRSNCCCQVPMIKPGWRM